MTYIIGYVRLNYIYTNDCLSVHDLSSELHVRSSNGRRVLVHDLASRVFVFVYLIFKYFMFCFILVRYVMG